MISHIISNRNLHIISNIKQIVLIHYSKYFPEFPEEKNVGLVHAYFPTLNRKNEAMAGVDESDCEPNDNLVVKDNMALAEECFYSQTMGQ